MGRLGPDRLPGVDLLPGPPDRDWGWPAYRFEIPAAWPSGVYVAMLVGTDAAGREHRPDPTTADGTSAKALFVVRSPAPGRDASILLKLAWATYHAYNATGYGSLYAEAAWTDQEGRPGFTVTTRRPGGGTGGEVMYGDSPDHYDPITRRQTFAHWEAPFIQWLEANGYRADYATDWDLQVDPDLLRPYALMLSVGHDEYWSEEMRGRVEAFVRRGGHVAFLSGNICGYRIRFVDGDTAFTCAKVRPSGRGRTRPRRWASTPPTGAASSSTRPRPTGPASSAGTPTWTGSRGTSSTGSRWEWRRSWARSRPWAGGCWRSPDARPASTSTPRRCRSPPTRTTTGRWRGPRRGRRMAPSSRPSCLRRWTGPAPSPSP